MLVGSPAPLRRVVLVSDLQAAGLQADPRLPEGIALEIVPVGGPLPVNLSLLGAWRDAAADDAGGRVVLRARVANTGGEAASAALQVRVDGLDAGLQPVSLPPGGRLDLAVPVFPAVDRPTRVHLALDAADALPADDARYLVIAPPRALRVLSVAPPDAGPHLPAALAQARMPRVVHERIPAARLTAGALSAADVVVLEGVTPENRAAVDALAERVAAGAGLLVLAGEGATGAAGALGGATGALVAADTAFASPESAHPVVAGAGGEALAGIPVWRYRKLAPGTGDTVLARYEDGAPALVARDHGAGRVLVVTTAADPAWSALPLDPAFLPLLLESMAWLGGHRVPPLDVAPGSVLDAAAHAGSLAGGTALAAALAAGETLRVRSPAGRERRLRPGDALRLDEAGFHELRAGGAPALPVAVSLRGAESDLTALTPEEFLARLQRDPPLAPAPRREGGAGAEDDRFARALLVLAVCLLLAEGALAGALARRRAREAGA